MSLDLEQIEKQIKIYEQQKLNLVQTHEQVKGAIHVLNSQKNMLLAEKEAKEMEEQEAKDIKELEELDKM